MFRIARRVARDRVISTVDTDARHGHKTSSRGFDGFKGHVAIDPDSEVITATEVTAGNTGDAEAAADLLADELPTTDNDATDNDATDNDATDNDATDNAQDAAGESGEASLAVYGDAAYGAGELLVRLERAGAEIRTKVQPPVAPGGRFTKDRFTIDLAAATRSPAPAR